MFSSVSGLCFGVQGTYRDLMPKLANRGGGINMQIQLWDEDAWQDACECYTLLLHPLLPPLLSPIYTARLYFLLATLGDASSLECINL